ncbi:MAG: hypothetical protein IEMM0002_0643 [bacterium]|nr:MAG: hypothetical protein IEMM0002_0643 [bacterium]
MEEEEKGFVVRDKRGSAEEEVKRPESGEQAPQRPAETKPDSTESAGSGEMSGKMPEITFTSFILSLSSSIAMSLGGYQDPVSGHVPQNIELAKQTIDIMGILKEKTMGNLSDEEQKFLDSSLYELRMRYIEEVNKAR